MFVPPVLLFFFTPSAFRNGAINCRSAAYKRPPPERSCDGALPDHVRGRPLFDLLTDEAKS